MMLPADVTLAIKAGVGVVARGVLTAVSPVVTLIRTAFPLRKDVRHRSINPRQLPVEAVRRATGEVRASKDVIEEIGTGKGPERH